MVVSVSDSNDILCADNLIFPHFPNLLRLSLRITGSKSHGRLTSRLSLLCCSSSLLELLELTFRDTFRLDERHRLDAEFWTMFCNALGKHPKRPLLDVVLVISDLDTCETCCSGQFYSKDNVMGLSEILENIYVGGFRMWL